MSELPRGWVAAPLHLLVRTKSGNSKLIKGRLSSSPEPGLVPAYSASGQDIWCDAAEWNGEGIVLSAVGARCGKAFFASGSWTAIANTHVIVPHHEIEAKFLWYRFNDEGFWVKSGSAQPFVKVRDSLEKILLLPPLVEQRRIVTAIEEHFSRLDAAEQSLRHAEARLTLFRSLVLADLSNAHWPRTRVADVALVGSGATPRRGRSDYWIGGTVPWVTSGQLTNPFVREPAAFITEKALRETNVRLWPAHTLLVALYGEGKTRGHCSELLFEATTNQACAAIVLTGDAVDRDYLRLFFAASYDSNRRLASGGVQPNLSLGLIKGLTFPLPPLPDQRRIVAEIERRLSLVDALAAAIAAALKRSAALRRSILERAFSGQLVPQDPTDEPASVLLKRIRAERESAPAAKQRRRRVAP